MTKRKLKKTRKEELWWRSVVKPRAGRAAAKTNGIQNIASISRNTYDTKEIRHRMKRGAVVEIGCKAKAG